MSRLQRPNVRHARARGDFTTGRLDAFGEAIDQALDAAGDVEEFLQRRLLALLLGDKDALDHLIEPTGGDADAGDVGVDFPRVDLPDLLRVAQDDQAVEFLAEGVRHD